MSLDSTAISILEAKYRRSASYPGQTEINSEIPNRNSTFHLAGICGSWVCLQSFVPQVRLPSSAWSILGDQAETPPTAGGRSVGRRGRPRLGMPLPSSLQRPAAHPPAAQPPRLPAALPAPTGSPPGIERGPPPPAPPGPADLRDGRREGLLARGTDQPRLEKCQSQGQQAASSHLRDRRSVPSLPARRRRSCTRRRRDRAGAPTSAGGRAGRGGQSTGGRPGRGWRTL